MARIRILLAPIVLGIFIGIELSFLFQDGNWLMKAKWPVVRDFFLQHGPSRGNNTATDTSLGPVNIGTKKDRILCWVLTCPKNHKKKAKHVKLTWGRRCDKLIFMSSKEDKKLGAVALPNVFEGRDGLWDKTREAFQYIWKNYKDDYDWFLKADDDTYVVIENLRLMLSAHHTSSPIYFGCLINSNEVQQGYMSGGGGYVLSKEALRRFTQIAMPNKKLCPDMHPSEDVAIGKCLENVNVSAGDSRDLIGRHRFFPLTPEDILAPDYKSLDYGWWEGYRHFPVDKGLNCCSESAISFHYVSPRQMYVLEYFIYNLKPWTVAAA